MSCVSEEQMEQLYQMFQQFQTSFTPYSSVTTLVLTGNPSAFLASSSSPIWIIFIDS